MRDHPAKEKLEKLLDHIFSEMRHLGLPIRHARLHVHLEEDIQLTLNGSVRPDHHQRELLLEPPTVRGAHG